MTKRIMVKVEELPNINLMLQDLMATCKNEISNLKRKSGLGELTTADTKKMYEISRVMKAVSEEDDRQARLDYFSKLSEEERVKLFVRIIKENPDYLDAIRPLMLGSGND